MRSSVRSVVGLCLAVGSISVAGRAEAATITLGGSCSLKNAIATANANANTGGCTHTGTFDATALSSGNHAASLCPGGGDVISVPTGSFTTASGDLLEVFSCIEIRGAGIASSTISIANDVAPSTNHGLAAGDCWSYDAGIYLSATEAERPNPPYLGLTTVTLKQASGGDTSGVCAVRGAVDVKGARVTGFGLSGINAVSKATCENGVNGCLETFGGPQVYVYGSSIIDQNRAPGSGGGINADGFYSYLSVDGSWIINNFSEGQGGGLAWHIGGGIYDVGSGPPFLNNSTVAGNSVIGSGGGVYVFSTSPNGYFLSPADNGGLVNSKITNNYATITAGGLFRDWDHLNYFSHGLVSSTIVVQNAADGSWCSTHFCPLASLHGKEYGEEANLNYPMRTTSCSGSMIYVLGHMPATGYAAPQLNDWDNPHHDVFDPANQPLNNNSSTGEATCTFDPIPEAELLCSGTSPASAPVNGATCTSANKTAGVTHIVVASSSYSNGGGTNFQATTSNQFVTYATPTTTIQPGTYNIKVGVKKANNAGIFQVAVADTLGGTYTNVGSTQDTFGSSSWTMLNIGNVTTSTAGSKFIRFTVTGKNTSSLGFQLFLDYITFERIEAHETESMKAVAALAAHDLVISSSYSGGLGTNLQATASGASVTYSTTAPLQPGTYGVVIGFKKGSNAGKFQFATAESPVSSFSNLGTEQDGYAMTNTWTSVTLPNVTWPTRSCTVDTDCNVIGGYCMKTCSDTKWACNSAADCNVGASCSPFRCSNTTRSLRFTVTTKNTASSSYQVFPDYVRLTRQ